MELSILLSKTRYIRITWDIYKKLQILRFPSREFDQVWSIDQETVFYSVLVKVR